MALTFPGERILAEAQAGVPKILEVSETSLRPSYIRAIQQTDNHDVSYEIERTHEIQHAVNEGGRKGFSGLANMAELAATGFPPTATRRSNSGKYSIGFGRRSTQNSTLQ